MKAEQERLSVSLKHGAQEVATVIRRSVPTHRLVGKTFIEFLNNHLPSSAAAISYFVMLALFPILFLVIDLGNRFPRFSHIKNYALETLILMVPKGAQDSLVEYLLDVPHPSTGEIITCVVILLWAASWACTIIEQAINRIWRTSCRSFLHGRLVSLLLMIGVGGLLFLSAMTTAALAFIYAEASRINPGVATNGTMWRIVFGVVGLLLTISLFALVYKVMPNTRVTIRETVPGAITAGFLYEFAKYLFAWFLAEVPYEGLYGSLATVLAALTWIYISNLLMLFGAQMTALLHCDYLLEPCHDGAHIKQGTRAMTVISSQ
jgi:membrane protein